MAPKLRTKRSREVDDASQVDNDKDHQASSSSPSRKRRKSDQPSPQVDKSHEEQQSTRASNRDDPTTEDDRTLQSSRASRPDIFYQLAPSGVHSYEERQSWLAEDDPLEDIYEAFSSSQNISEQEDWRIYGQVDTKIVGVQYYRGLANPGEHVLLRREPQNPYDTNAIRVDNVEGVQIGHIPRRMAEKLTPYIDQRLLLMEGRLTGRKTQFGCPLSVKLYGPDPESDAGKSVQEKMKADKLPLKALHEAERQEKKRAKERKEAEAKQLAARRAAAAAGRGGQVPIAKKNTPFANQTSSDGSGTVTLQFDMFESSQRINPRELSRVSDTCGMREELLKDLPLAAKPDRIATKMLPYQLQALQWLLDHENPQLPSQKSDEAVQLWVRAQHSDGVFTNLATNHSTSTTPQLARGGILADDMGLGKTLEMISLIVADIEANGPGPTLVVSPLSVMSNWSGQIAHHVSQEKPLKVHVYHGAGRTDMKPKDFANFDVVITTYQTLTGDYTPRGKSGSKRVPEKGLRDTGLYSVEWRRVVLDEGHIVRNPQAKGFIAVRDIAGKSRWVLTGTPIINSLRDLYAMLRLIGVTGGLETLETFNTTLVRPLKSGDSSAASLLQAIMTAFTLRRRKDMSFIDLRLPKLDEYIHLVTFSKKERERYDALYAEAKGLLVRYEKSYKGQSQTYSHLLTLLLRMRQCCNHWQLCGERVTSLLEQLESSQMVELNAANTSALQDILQVQIESQEDCAICLETLHEPVITHCGHAFGLDCIARVIEAQHKCPMCRAELKDETCLVRPARPCGEDESDADLDLNASSTKIEALVKILDQTRRSGKAEKTIVFSQWTSFLDLVQARLEREGHTYCRIDGSMRADERDEALHALDHDHTCTVMLASLGVCAVGLNLTAANQIVLCDTWWAPAIEDQAVDRVHRLGQKRETRVFRLVVEDSIEQRTLDVQRDKRKLMMLAFAEKESRRGDARTGRLADIQKLLQ